MDFGIRHGQSSILKLPISISINSIFPLSSVWGTFFIQLCILSLQLIGNQFLINIWDIVDTYMIFKNLFLMEIHIWYIMRSFKAAYHPTYELPTMIYSEWKWSVKHFWAIGSDGITIDLCPPEEFNQQVFISFMKWG